MHTLLLLAIGQIPTTTITSPGPLTNIWLGNDGSVQVSHVLDTDFVFYGPDIAPADAGTFVVVDGVLYAIDINAHDYSAASSIGAHTPFTLVSQSAVTGTGTTTDPYRSDLVLDCGTSGIRLLQVDTYVEGFETYRTDIDVINSSTVAKTVIVYRAADCYLANSDAGYGAANVATGAVACTANANNSPPGRIEQWQPITAGATYYEAGYDEVWSWISTHQPFPNTCRCDEFIDNGAGISWQVTIPAGGSVNVAHLTTFSPLGQIPLITAKTASTASVAATDVVAYTITVANPNPVAVQVLTIEDDLPVGFSYVMDTSRGAIPADPTINGQRLVWAGPVPVPANGTIEQTFDIQVPTSTGTYFNLASATSTGGYVVTPTGPSAPVDVMLSVLDGGVPDMGTPDTGTLDADTPDADGVDTGEGLDAGVGPDTGGAPDAGATPDTGVSAPDAGAKVPDTGVTTRVEGEDETDCACSAAHAQGGGPSSLLLLMLLGWVCRKRR